MLYELFPEFLFNPNYAVTHFVIPVAAMVGIMIGLPRFMNRGKSPKSPKSKIIENESGNDLLDQIIAEDGQSGIVEASSQQTVQESPVMPESSEGVKLESSEIENVNSELDALLKEGDNPDMITADVLGGATTSGLNEGNVRDMIDEKFEPVEKDLFSFKKDLNKIKEDMKVTKENVDSLTESFEGTLTDMKAFQAEIANPLNFMRKYFEAIDIKSLSDPSLPLKQSTGDVQQSVALPQQPVMNTQPAQVTQPSQNNSEPNPIDSVMKPLFSGNLSISNLMSIVELAGEMLRENGDDCIDLLVEQCKLMGLKDEDESTIYNIIDMLKKSDLNVEDTLIQLYKFAKIVGINDKEADAHYTKLLATKQQKSKKGD
ncbi:MAG: hypothetical protein ACE5RJ_05205 [Nitrosopumilaceae archaeon]